MSDIPSVPEVISPALDGEITYCSCGATETEGHTFGCIMEQVRRNIDRKKSSDPTDETLLDSFAIWERYMHTDFSNVSGQLRDLNEQFRDKYC